MRRSLPYVRVYSRVALLLGLLACAVVSHAQSASTTDQASPPRRIAGLGFPVPLERLATIRGGFDLGNGLEVSFGIERAVYIDGNLVTYANVSVPDVAHITSQQAVALASALSTVNVVQNGPGNTFDPSSLSQTSVATVIQNTLNNQTIRNITTLNVSVNTLNVFRDGGLQQALQAVQAQALGH
ncbi:hypothetical protein GCM10007862_16120 [Dyella lipolytica]|uniref:Uncharacterized protein n=1 Tax=Dyella lipolytica TaxID=1867835 RepID=A0ABW8IV48_9GAMM|nr:hypothetical protein [Dyella lipolytica]GLQ46561.1 hypothetical protein GCM10007862_16120 [Dyella lipolytica]